MNMSDWNGWTGSQMYRDGLASGLIDFNGSLYHWGDQGFAKLNMTTNMTNGAYGFYADGGGSGGLQNWSGIQGITGVKSREYAGAGYQWHTVGQWIASHGGGSQSGIGFGDILSGTDKHLNGGLGTLGVSVQGYNALPNDIKRAYAFKLSKLINVRSGAIFQKAQGLARGAGKVVTN